MYGMLCPQWAYIYFFCSIWPLKKLIKAKTACQSVRPRAANSAQIRKCKQIPNWNFKHWTRHRVHGASGICWNNAPKEGFDVKRWNITGKFLHSGCLCCCLLSQDFNEFLFFNNDLDELEGKRDNKKVFHFFPDFKIMTTMSPQQQQRWRRPCCTFSTCARCNSSPFQVSFYRIKNNKGKDIVNVIQITPVVVTLPSKHSFVQMTRQLVRCQSTFRVNFCWKLMLLLLPPRFKSAKKSLPFSR